MPTSLTSPSTQSPSTKADVTLSPTFLFTVKNTYEQVMVGNDDLEMLTPPQVLAYETLLSNQALNNTNMNNIEVKLINQTLESRTTTRRRLQTIKYTKILTLCFDIKIFDDNTTEIKTFIQNYEKKAEELQSEVRELLVENGMPVNGVCSTFEQRNPPDDPLESCFFVPNLPTNSIIPTNPPTLGSTIYPTSWPTASLLAIPTDYPTLNSYLPSNYKTTVPTASPTVLSTSFPVIFPTQLPTSVSTTSPSSKISSPPSSIPSDKPLGTPSLSLLFRSSSIPSN